MHKRMGEGGGGSRTALERLKRKCGKAACPVAATYMRGAYNVCRAGAGFVAGAGPPLKS